MNLSPHFTYDEMTRSAKADDLGIKNIPTTEHIGNLRYLCETVLEPLRAHYKKPIKVTSGYRNIAVNLAVGGTSKSQHCVGEAVDCEIDGIPNIEVADWVSENLLFDQVILEFYNPPQGINSGWVHISVKRNGNNRKSKLVAFKDGKKTVYKAITDFSSMENDN